MSIRASFILILIFCLATLAGSVAVGAHLYVVQESDAAFQREASAHLDRVEDILHIYFRGAEQAARNLASLPEARTAIPPKDGDPAAQPAEPPTAENARQNLLLRLAALPALIPGVETAFCGYRDGFFLSDSPAAPPVGYDPRTQSWYGDTAWGVADVSVTNIVISENSKSMVATVAAKIRDGNGETLGVAALTVNLAPLTDALRDIRLGRTGYLALFDAEGRVLFDPKAQENLLRPAAEADAALLSLVQLPGGLHALSRDGTAITAFSRQFDANRWKAAILMDRAEQTAPDNRLARIATAIAAATALVLALLGTVLAVGATRPLYALIRQSKALAEGNDAALAGIPGRGPDITALQGNIGQLTGRVMLLAQAEKGRVHEIESRARKILAAEQEHTGKSARNAYRAACANAARAITPVADQAAQTASALLDWTGKLHEYTKQQVLAATTARTATRSVLDVSSTMARQAEETEKSAEAVLAFAQKVEKLQQETTRSLESMEETARTLAAGLEPFRTGADRMGAAAGTVRDIAEDVNVLGLKLSIEVSGAGDAGRRFLPVTEEMRTLAEKMMAVAGKMENIVAAFEQTHAAHTLAVNKNTAATRRVAGNAAKTGAGISRAMEMTAATLEQIRVLATALEGMAQAAEPGSSSAEAYLLAARDAGDTLKKLHADADGLGSLAANLAALADSLATGPEEEEIIPTFPYTDRQPQKLLD